MIGETVGKFEALVQLVRDPVPEGDLVEAARSLNLLVWLCLVAPEPMRRLHPDLWERGKDWVDGVRRGLIPRPASWDQAAKDLEGVE